MDSKTEPASEAKETAYFLLSRNEHDKAWLFYKPIKDEPGKYSCWEPITEEFWTEFEKLQQAQEEITRLKAELERESTIRDLLRIIDSNQFYMTDSELEKVKAARQKIDYGKDR